MEHIRVSISVS